MKSSVARSKMARGMLPRVSGRFGLAVLLFLLLALALLACKKRETGEAPATDASVAPPVTTAAPAPAGSAVSPQFVLVLAWNDALDKHDADALDSIYGATVDYYGSSLPRARVVAAKRAALKAAPTFKQTIRDISFDPASPDTVARFLKRSGPAGKLREIRGKLVLREEAGKLRVVAEADEASEKRDASAECIHVEAETRSEKPVTLEGVLAKGRHGHPNGSSFPIHILTLASARCVLGSSDTSSVSEVQVMATDDKKLDALDGKKVRVSGSAFLPETAYHVRDVIIDASSVTKL